MKKGILFGLLILSSISLSSPIDPLPPLDPLASYRVIRHETPRGTEFLGADYVATVDSFGLQMESGGVRVHISGRRQPGVVEEYRFENRRVEQIFRVARRSGKGTLKITLLLPGQTHRRKMPEKRTSTSSTGMAFPGKRMRDST